jgi:hypothetical protein
MTTAPRSLNTFSRLSITVALVAGIALTPLTSNFSTPLALAQEGSVAVQELTAIPPRHGEDNSLTIKPGERKQFTIRVQNSSNQAVTINSLAQDFIVQDGETPIPVAPDEELSNRWSLASWMTIVPNEQLVLSGQTVGINVLIEAPADALPGGHYAMILHQPNAGDTTKKTTEKTVATETSASAVSQKVGTLVYLVVEGPINYEAFTRGFSAPKFTEFGPIPFSFTMDNRSDVHLRPQAKIEVSDVFNRTIETIPVETKNVFPFSSRLFDTEWQQTWGWGYYNAKLTVSFGNQGQLITDTIGFWFFPVKIVIAALIGLLTLVATGISVRRHLLHRNSDEQKRIALLEEKLRAMEQNKLRSYEDDTP